MPQSVTMEPTATRRWQHRIPREPLEAEHARLLPPARSIDAALDTAWLSIVDHTTRTTYKDQHQAQHTPTRKPLLYLGTHPDTAPFRVHKRISGRGMLYESENPSTLSVEVRETLVGFNIGDTAAPGLSALHI